MYVRLIDVIFGEPKINKTLLMSIWTNDSALYAACVMKKTTNQQCCATLQPAGDSMLRYAAAGGRCNVALRCNPRQWVNVNGHINAGRPVQVHTVSLRPISLLIASLYSGATIDFLNVLAREWGWPNLQCENWKYFLVTCMNANIKEKKNFLPRVSSKVFSSILSTFKVTRSPLIGENSTWTN